MIIKLKKVPAYYINLESDIDKGTDTKNLLQSLGFKKVTRSPGFISDSHAKGCGLAHQNILLSRSNDSKPFLVFEDDIFVKNFKGTIEVPDDADAVYLGLSKMGVVDDDVVENIILSRVEDFEDIVKINNMLAAHAILYINKDYVSGLSEYIKEYVEEGIPHDIAMAKYMSEHNVYAVNDPMFIQNGKFRTFTDRKIFDLDHKTIVD